MRFVLFFTVGLEVLKLHYEFNDENLTAAAAAAGAKLHAFTTTLDSVSQDIKRLEALLSEAGVCVEHWITGPNDNPLDCCEIRSIGWSKLNDRWRIVHHSSHEEHGGSSQRPLIEMLAPTRLRCAPYLVELLNEIAELVPEAHLKG